MRHAPIVIALLALVPLTADAKPKSKKPRGKAKASAKVEAKKHMDKGAKAHKAGKFDVALSELQAAYDLDPQPKLLFAIAQVQVKLDNCPDAITNYEKYIAGEKDKQKRAVVKQAIEACNQKIAAATPSPAPDPTPAPPPTEPVVAATEPEPSPAIEPAPVEPASPPVDDNPLQPTQPVIADRPSRGGTPWYKDVLGDALVLSGVAAGAVSVVMYTGARGKLDDAEAAPTLAEYDDLVDQAKSQRTISVVLAGGSAILITAGILRYKLRSNGEPRGVAIAPTAGGGLITWSGGF
jgi:hypothetical protein